MEDPALHLELINIKVRNENVPRCWRCRVSAGRGRGQRSSTSDHPVRS